MTMLRCSCPECNCGMRFLADAPRVCAACWHDCHDPWDARSREYSASRSGVESQSRLAVGTPPPLIRRPRTGELAAAAISESEAELREAWGK